MKHFIFILCFSSQKEEIGSFKKLVQHCNKQKLLPAVFFVFSKKRCMDIAFGLGDLGLTTKQEYRKITHFFDDAMKRLKVISLINWQMSSNLYFLAR